MDNNKEKAMDEADKLIKRLYRLMEENARLREVFERINNNLNELDEMFEQLQEERAHTAEQLKRIDKLEERIQNTRTIVMLEKTSLIYAILKEKDELND